VAAGTERMSPLKPSFARHFASALMPRFQLSLARLMIITALAVVVLLLVVKFTGFLTGLLWCLLPTPLVIMVIYGRGDVQAFAIGALVPFASLRMLDAPPFNLWYLGSVLWMLPVGALCGILAVVTRRFVQPHRNE
jgi:hypothetical protein